VHTIMSDNGREFTNHQAIAAHLAADFYFTHPFASWERGLGRTSNPLICWSEKFSVALTNLSGTFSFRIAARSQSSLFLQTAEVFKSAWSAMKVVS